MCVDAKHPDENMAIADEPVPPSPAQARRLRQLHPKSMSHESIIEDDGGEAAMEKFHKHEAKLHEKLVATIKGDAPASTISNLLVRVGDSTGWALLACHDKDS